MGNECVGKQNEKIKSSLNKTFPRTTAKADELKIIKQEIATSTQTLPPIKCHVKKPIHEEVKV